MKINYLSSVTLGTMRLADKCVTSSTCVDIFEAALLNGINSFHVSSEYNSFPLVCSALKKLSKKTRDINLVVKLSSPHFDENKFCHANLESKIDDVLRHTGLEQIQLAQWMWRQYPLDDSQRIPMLVGQADEIKSSFQNLIEAGKVSEFCCFPYTADFMKSVSQLEISKIHINYLNFWENSLTNGGFHDASIVLRPFFAGKIKDIAPQFIEELNVIEDGNAIFHSLNYVLSHPRVLSAVIGINSVEQLNEIISVSSPINKDIKVFEKYQSLIENNPHLS